MSEEAKSRARRIRGKLSWNNRLPEGQRRTLEEIEMEVDREMAEGPRLEEEKAIRSRSRDRAKYYEIRELWLRDLRELETLEQALAECESFGNSWSQSSGHFGEGREIEYECRRIDDGREGIYRRHRQSLKLIEHLGLAGLLKDVKAIDEAMRIAKTLFLEELRAEELRHWADAIEANDFTLLMRGFPEKTPADLDAESR